MPKKTSSKIGVGLITCDRIEFFNQAKDSLVKALKDYPDYEIIIINDGSIKIKDDSLKIIDTIGYQGVGKAKNAALKYLLENNCKHIFLMEDDITITNGKIFQKYIEASEATGIKHFNFALHGHHNLNGYGLPNIKKTINYPSDLKIDLYENVLGALSYYHKDTITDCGYMDEKYYNALEHVDHTYQIIKAGYHPPFRWFADINGSSDCISDIKANHQDSKIRSQEDFMKTFKIALDYFIEKNNFSVSQGYGPAEKIATESEVLDNLKEIWKQYHQK
jgi:glycosyltransferase involved in cell wall biosynthesis